MDQSEEEKIHFSYQTYSTMDTKILKNFIRLSGTPLESGVLTQTTLDC